MHSVMYFSLFYVTFVLLISLLLHELIACELSHKNLYSIGNYRYYVKIQRHSKISNLLGLLLLKHLKLFTLYSNSK